MALPLHFLAVYGYALLFAWVLVEQLGIPLPATPVLIAAGALSAQDVMRWPLVFAAGLAAALLSDCCWFFVGRRYGQRVLRLLCKLSLEPTTCVRRTQDSFGRMRGNMLLWAKFVPVWRCWHRRLPARTAWPSRSFFFSTALARRSGQGAGFLSAGSLAPRSKAIRACWPGRRASPACCCPPSSRFLAARVLRRRAVLRELAAARLEPRRAEAPARRR